MHALIRSRFPRPILVSLILSVLLVHLAACSPPTATQSLLQVSVLVDGSVQKVELPAGSTAGDAVEIAGLELNNLDRIEPPDYTVLTSGAEVRIVRVSEEFTIQEEIIPFERQTLQTESLPDQERLLVQVGLNGLREITYRQVFEDGVEISRNAVKTLLVQEAVPEIVMVGVQNAYTAVNIPGRLAYLLGGNAWIMEGSTGIRRAVVTTADLDGHIFSLSDDGSWLLFTRRSSEEAQINSLWAADLDSDPVELFDLEVANVIHYAGWVQDPDNDRVAFSTVEPRDTAPGWQANNDFNVLSFSPSGWVSQWRVYVEANSGGLYGWWGTGFSWGPDGDTLAYVRPDGIGLVELDLGQFTPRLEVLPFQTGGDWAWAPGMSWSPDGVFLYTVDHNAPPGAQNPEASTDFSLVAVSAAGGDPIPLVERVGMFAYPVLSPQLEPESDAVSYNVAFLRSLGANELYELVVMDRDGSNQRVLFPNGDQTGLSPQQVVWSPGPLPGGGVHALALLHKGNLWLVETNQDGTAWQVTGDGLVSRVDWKNH